MAFIRFKDFTVLFLTILASGVCQSYAHRYRAHARESLDTLFDEAITQLSPRVTSGSNSRLPKSTKNDVNNCIQSFVDSLGARCSVPVAKNSVRSYSQPTHNRPRLQSTRLLIKNKPREALSNSIDFLSNPVDLSDQDFYNALDRFKQNRDFGQLALQHVIDLLDDELNLVRHLIAGHTGIVMQGALDKRNNTLHHTIPLAIDLYDTILSVSTYVDKHAERLNRHTMDGKRLPKALTAYDQKMFLSNLENNIEKYQAIIRDLQHNVQTNVIAANQSNLTDERTQAINKYLQTLT
jgi:hypothetical protein